MQVLMVFTIWALMCGSGWIFPMNEVEVKERVAAHGGTARDKCWLTTQLRNRAIWLSSISGSGVSEMSNDDDFIIISLR